MSNYLTDTKKEWPEVATEMAHARDCIQIACCIADKPGPLDTEAGPKYKYTKEDNYSDATCKGCIKAFEKNYTWVKVKWTITM